MNKMYLNVLQRARFLLLALLLVSGAAHAQTTHNITNVEPNSLETFVETGEWAAGDIIQLTSPGVYEVSGSIDINKSVTLMGDPSLSSRPVIKYTTTENGIRANANDLNITIKGIDFDGYLPGGVARVVYLYKSNATVTGVNSLVLEDSKAWGFTSAMELHPTNYLARYESVLINNVEWSDFGVSTSIYPINLRLGAVKDFRVTNSTFSNLHLGFISPPYFSVGTTRPDKILQHYLFENNTFYKVAGLANGSLIQFNDPNDNSIKITFRNNLVSTLFNPLIARPFRINANAGQPEEGGVKPLQFVNNVFHDYNSPHQESVHNLATVAARADANVSNNITSDPMFLSPERGDFRLLPGSPALTASTTGGPVGDPEWVVGVHPIANTVENGLEDLIKTGTWAAGDIIMLTSAGVYPIAATVDIPRSVTIMGDPALASRPVIHFSGASGSFRGDSDNFSVVFSNVDFNGYLGVTTTSRTPYIFRGNLPATAPVLGTHFGKVVFENSKAWGFTGGLILNNNTYRVLADEVILHNVDWSDMVGAYAINLNQNGVKSLRVMNSTFHNISNGFLNNAYSSAGTTRPVVLKQNILIENNTFYKVAGNGNNSLIQMNDPKDESVMLVFRNNVVSMLHTVDSRPFRLDPLAGTFIFANNVFHDFNTTTESKAEFNLAVLAATQANVTATNTIETAPGFADPETGNFKLPNNSPLATAGTTGGLIGDPQWAPDNVTSTKPELAAAKIEAYPNPVRDVLYINAASVVEVTLYNASGAVILKQTIDRTGTIKTAGIKPGLYFARINTGNQVQTVKLLKE